MLQVLEFQGDVQTRFGLTFEVAPSSPRPRPCPCLLILLRIPRSHGSPYHFDALLQVEYEAGFGEMRTESLGGYPADTPVTNNNREEFVKLYTKHLLHDRIQSQYEAFSQVCLGPAPSWSRPYRNQLTV